MVIATFSASAGVTQLVECDLAKVDVAGSNPVSRSKVTFVISSLLSAVGAKRNAQSGATSWCSNPLTIVRGSVPYCIRRTANGL
jgi:hypothetical protein